MAMGVFGISVRLVLSLLHSSSRSGVLVKLTPVCFPDSYVQDGRVSTVCFGGYTSQGQVFG